MCPPKLPRTSVQFSSWTARPTWSGVGFQSWIAFYPRSTRVRLAVLMGMAAVLIMTALLPRPVRAGEFERTIGGLARGQDGIGRCSAVFFAPDRALTVGHCIADRHHWGAPKDDLTVVLDGERLPVIAVRMSPEPPFLASGGIGDLANDWAILTVLVAQSHQIEPVPFAGKAGVAAAAVSADTVVKVGFEEGTLRQSSDCRVENGRDASRTFPFRCGAGAGPGLSGSALFMHTDRGFALLGVQSAKTTGPRVFGIGVAPPEEVMER